jgi:hypothetical protein
MPAHFAIELCVLKTHENDKSTVSSCCSDDIKSLARNLRPIPHNGRADDICSTNNAIERGATHIGYSILKHAYCELSHGPPGGHTRLMSLEMNVSMPV